MGQIYSEAEEVVIWIGPSADRLDELIDTLQLLGESKFESRGPTH